MFPQKYGNKLRKKDIAWKKWGSTLREGEWTYFKKAV